MLQLVKVQHTECSSSVGSMKTVPNRAKVSSEKDTDTELPEERRCSPNFPSPDLSVSHTQTPTASKRRVNILPEMTCEAILPDVVVNKVRDGLLPK